MSLERIDSPALRARLGAGLDLPEQAARVAAEWLPGRNGRPAVLMLVLLWAKGGTNLVRFLEATLQAFYAEVQSTPQSWSEGQAVRQVLAALNHQLYAHRARQDGPWEVSAGVLLVQGDEVGFFQVGDCGLLRWQSESLQSLAGQTSAPLGVQPELGLIQHALPLECGHLLLLAPQPLLAVADHERLRYHCARERGETLDALLAPLLVAPGAAAVLRAGDTESQQWLAPTANWPVQVPEPGLSCAGWRLTECCPFGPAGRLWCAEREGQSAWLWFAEREQDEILRQREWLLRRVPVEGLPLLPVCGVRREQALCLVEPLPGRVQSLAAWRDVQQEVGAAEVLAVLRPLTSAVRALQRRGVLGVVLDPQLILLNADGQLVFLPEQAAQWPGGARQLPQAAGLPMAPEVREAQRLDGAVDQFALAAVAYWLLSGQWPDAAEGKQRQARYQPLTGRVRALPAGWDGVLARALAPQPTARYAALSEFMQALERPLEAADGTAEKRRWPAVWRQTAVLVVGLQLLLALLLTLV